MTQTISSWTIKTSPFFLLMFFYNFSANLFLLNANKLSLECMSVPLLLGLIYNCKLNFWNELPFDDSFYALQ